MAKFDRTGAPYTRDTHDHNGVDNFQHQAERLARGLGQSAQQVWLAGIGALGRAQSEGSRLFDSLVEEGSEMQRNTREMADRQTAAARDSVGQARDRAGESWGRLERAFEDRVQRTLSRLGVPVRDDLSELSRRIDALTSELRRINAATTGRGADTSSARPRPTTHKASHTSPHASPVKKATVRKTPVRKSAKGGGAAPGL